MIIYGWIRGVAPGSESYVCFRFQCVDPLWRPHQVAGSLDNPKPVNLNLELDSLMTLVSSNGVLLMLCHFMNYVVHEYARIVVYLLVRITIERREQLNDYEFS